MTATADLLFERLLNRAVAQARADSPRAVALLAALRGRRLAIEVSGTPFACVVESSGEALHVYPAGDAGATIVGAPLSLLALGGADPEAVIRRGDVRVSGDAELAAQYRELANLMRPDLEALLGRLVGRAPAHLAMRGVESAARWSRAAAWTAVQNISEYLAHERGDLVARAEAEHYLAGVEQLREQLDRADARLSQLERRARILADGPA